jgi:hypothetical protein
MKVDGLTRGWRQLQVPCVALHDCAHQMVLCNLMEESLMDVHVAPVTVLKMNGQFSTKSCMEIPLGSSTSGIANI